MPHVQQVEAIAKMNVSTKHRWLDDATTPVLLIRPIPSPLRALLPEIDSASKPVVVVAAQTKPLLTQKNSIPHASVAPVVADHLLLVAHRPHDHSFFDDSASISSKSFR